MRSRIALPLCLTLWAATLAGPHPFASAQTPRRSLSTREFDTAEPAQQAPRPAADGAQNRPQPPAPAADGPCVFARPVDPSYFESAEATGGQLYMLAPAEVGRASDLASLDAKGYRESIFRAGGDLGGGEREFVVPLDASVGRVAFVAFVECKESISVTAPDGREAAQGAFLSNEELRAGRLLTVNAPAAGEWRVRLRGRGKFTLAVKAQTDLSFYTLMSVGRPDGRVEFRVTMRGDEAAAALDETGLRLKLLAGDGTELQTAELRKVESDKPGATEYVTETSAPPVRYRVAVVGRNAQGQTILRVQPFLKRAPGE